MHFPHLIFFGLLLPIFCNPLHPFEFTSWIFHIILICYHARTLCPHGVFSDFFFLNLHCISGHSLLFIPNTVNFVLIIYFIKAFKEIVQLFVVFHIINSCFITPFFPFFLSFLMVSPKILSWMFNSFVANLFCF